MLAMVNKKLENRNAATGITRRTLLEGFASFSALALVSPFSIAAPQSAQPADTFLKLSMQLTQVNLLNPKLSERLYQALKAESPQFDGELQALAQAVATAGTDITTALKPTAKNTAKRILSAWFTGIVGEGLDAKVITYRHALQFNAVDDVLVIRSYCPNKPGFWRNKPTERKA